MFLVGALTGRERGKGPIGKVPEKIGKIPEIGARQKGDGKWEKPVSAKICRFLRFPAKICASRKSAKICNNLRKCAFRVRFKAFSSKRGLFFTVKGPRALPKFHTDPPPLALPTGGGGGFTENPSRGSTKREGGGEGGGGGWCLCGIWGARARPLHCEKKAPFRWKRLVSPFWRALRKDRESPKKDKKGQVQIGKPPRLNPQKGS